MQTTHYQNGLARITKVLLVTLITTVGIATAQNRTVEINVSQPSPHNIGSVQAFADESGYLLLRFSYAAQYNTFILYHRDKGEVGRFDGIIGITTILGFSSADQEFTLYLKGHYQAKNDYYFLTFFKNSSRRPIITNWLDPVANDDHLVRYSAMNKLYLYENQKEGIDLIEIENHGSFKRTHINIDKSTKKKFAMPASPVVTMPGATVSYYPNESLTQVVPYPDSVIMIGTKKWSMEDPNKGTSIIKIDLANQKISLTEMNFVNSDNNYAAILNDRFFLVGFSENGLGFAILEYPSLRPIKKYTLNDSIPFRHGNLLDLDGEAVDAKWEAEKKDKKTINKMGQGSPFLFVQKAAGGFFLRLGSKVVKSTPSASYGGVYSAGSSNTSFFYLDAYIDKNGEPNDTKEHAFWNDILQNTNKLKTEKKTNYTCEAASSKYYYTIHFSDKLDKCFINEYNLSNQPK